MQNRRSFLWTAAAAMLPISARVEAAGSEFPSRPVRLVVPLAPGGAAELVARLVAEHCSQQWGQPVVVDMRPGGGTVIGSNIVAHAPADGHTLLFSANSLVINAKLHAHLPYDGLKAFEPVAEMVASPQVLVVRADSSSRDFPDWLSDARSRPGQVSVAALGPATTQHLAVAALQQATGTSLIFAPFVGGAPAINALLGGHVDAALANLSEVLPQVLAGRLWPLAVTSARRDPLLAQVPTVAESGFPGFEALAWFGLSAPAGTPGQVIAELARSVGKALLDPLIVQRLITAGLRPAFNGPAEFSALIDRMSLHYAHLIDSTHLQIEG